MLDGEGGYPVWGKLLPAATSLQLGGLPLGLAQGIRLRRAMAADLTPTAADRGSRHEPAAALQFDCRISRPPAACSGRALLP